MVSGTERLDWRPASAPPDADLSVLVFTGCDDYPVELGHFDGQQWVSDAGGHELRDVQCWAQVNGPQQVDALPLLLAALKAARTWVASDCESFVECHTGPAGLDEIGTDAAASYRQMLEHMDAAIAAAEQPA